MTLSGTVSDGSGHGWPLPVKITATGTPLAPVYSSPFSGAYSISVPAQATYTLHVTPVYPGYAARTVSVQVAGGNTTGNISLAISGGCTAPGYSYNGAGTQFTGWAGTVPQDGWSVTDNNGSAQTWMFGNATGEGQPPGGDADFAIADSHYYSSNFSSTPMDTSLVSPAVDLSQISKPVVAFDTWYQPDSLAQFAQAAEVDVSTDGGQSWARVWQRTVKAATGRVVIPIPQAAGQNNVKVRFRYTGDNDYWWSVGNVFIGTTTCIIAPGGLVAGTVTAAAAGTPLGAATVTSTTSPGEAGTSAARPADPALARGFYYLFAAGTGSQQFTATAGGYAATTAAATITGGAVTRKDWALQAGHITVTSATITATQTLGQTTTADVTFTNTGTAPAPVTLTPADSGYTPRGGTAAATPRGAPLQRIKIRGRLTIAALASAARAAAPVQNPRKASAGTASSSWSNIPTYPAGPITLNAAAYDPQNGQVYSVGGEPFLGDTSVSDAYTYQPSSGQWNQIASLPQPLIWSSAAFTGGKLYVVGGGIIRSSSMGILSSALYVYDPSSGTWSEGASLPADVLGANVAVLDGQIYTVGGCGVIGGALSCPSTPGSVYRYSPAQNTWTRLANYPVPVIFGACAGISGELVCAGGSDVNHGGINPIYKSVYVYSPESNTWFRAADMPYTDVFMGYAGANDRLQVFGGLAGGASSNQAAQYDPVTNMWSALPNMNQPTIWGGSSCGLYLIGGTTLPALPTSRRRCPGTASAARRACRGYPPAGPGSLCRLASRSPCQSR